MLNGSPLVRVDGGIAGYLTHIRDRCAPETRYREMSHELSRVNWIPATARERRRVEFVNIGEARSQGLRFCQAMSPMCVRKAKSVCSLRTPSAPMSALAKLTKLT